MDAARRDIALVGVNAPGHEKKLLFRLGILAPGKRQAEKDGISLEGVQSTPKVPVSELS